MGLIIDNFAGGGGASTGIELALGRHVDIAINHDPQAIAMHKMNHPLTTHFTEDVFDIDPVKVCHGQSVDLCWLSPDCTHFSRAKGGVPVSKKIRGLAWIACRWAATVKPKVIILENVQEFKTWGPLTKEGYPDKRKKGQTFNKFVNTLKEHGYSVDYKELLACDYGAPTSRKRFFLIARIDGEKIVWPTPSYCKDGKNLPKWKSAASIIDWNISTKSIFDRKKPLSDATNKRIARGIVKFVLENPKPFILSNNFNNTGSDAESPLPTVTTQSNHSSLISPTLIQTGYGEAKGQAPRVPGLDKPIGTIVSSVKHCLVEAFLNKNLSKEETGSIKGNQAIYTASIIKHFGGGYQGSGADIKEPLPTVTSVDHNGLLVCAFLDKYYGTGLGQDLKKPLAAITSKDRFSLVTLKVN